MPSDALPSPQITSASPRTRSLASQLLDVRLLKLDKATDSPNSASSNPVAGEATVIIADYPHCISSLRQRPITTAHSQHTDNRSTNDSAHVSHLRPLNVSPCTQPSLMGDQSFEMDRRVRGGAKVGGSKVTRVLPPRVPRAPREPWAPGTSSAPTAQFLTAAAAVPSSPATSLPTLCT